MSKRVSTPAGVVTFPDTMTDEEISAAVPEAIHDIQMRNINSPRGGGPGYKGEDRPINWDEVAGQAGDRLLDVGKTVGAAALMGPAGGAYLGHQMGKGIEANVHAAHDAALQTQPEEFELQPYLNTGHGPEDMTGWLLRQAAQSPNLAKVVLGSAAAPNPFAGTTQEVMNAKTPEEAIGKGGTDVGVLAAGSPAGMEAIGEGFNAAKGLPGAAADVGARAITSEPARAVGRFAKRAGNAKVLGTDFGIGDMLDALAEPVVKAAEGRVSAQEGAAGVGRMMNQPQADVPLNYQYDPQADPHAIDPADLHDGVKTGPGPGADRVPMWKMGEEIQGPVEESANAGADRIIKEMGLENPDSSPAGPDEADLAAQGDQASLDLVTKLQEFFQKQHGVEPDPGLIEGLMQDEAQGMTNRNFQKLAMSPTEAKIAAEGYDENMNYRPPPELVGGTEADRNGFTTEGGGGANYTPDDLAEVKARLGLPADARLEMVGGPEGGTEPGADLFDRPPMRPPGEPGVESMRDDLQRHGDILDAERDRAFYERNKPGKPKSQMVEEMQKVVRKKKGKKK